MKRYKSINDVIESLNESNLLNNIEILINKELFIYKNLHQKINVLCKKCGNVSIKEINSLFHGYGCKYCHTQNNKIRNYYSNETLKKKIADITNGEYELISNDSYRSRDIGTFRHNDEKCLNKNKIFKMKIHGFLTLNYRCPFCNRTSKGLRESKAIKNIHKYLDDLNIKYVKEQAFDNCRSSKGKLLYFDIFIDEMNILIEYDGPQHYKPIDYFGGEDVYLRTLENDNIKNNFAKKNNYTLIRINKISDINKTLDKYFK